ncbi:MAG: TRAP transporter small permease subunit [Burkholderiaceae bacterium]
MEQYVRGMSRVCDAMALVAALCLATATVVICWMVLYRTLGYSTSWELELGVFLMVCSLFLASPYTLKTKGHVGVDLLSVYLPPATARTLTAITLVVGLAATLFLGFLGLEFALDSFLKGERTESVWAPYKWPLYATMPIGFFMTSAQYVAEIMVFIKPELQEQPA